MPTGRSTVTVLRGPQGVITSSATASHRVKFAGQRGGGPGDGRGSAVKGREGTETAGPVRRGPRPAARVERDVDRRLGDLLSGQPLTEPVSPVT